MDVYKVPLTITSSFASTRTRWTHGPKALSTRGDGAAEATCDKAMCVGALLRVPLLLLLLLRVSLLLLLLLLLMLLLCAGLRVVHRVAAFGPSSVRALCGCVRCCCWAPDGLLRAVLRPHVCPRQGRRRPTRRGLYHHAQRHPRGHPATSTRTRCVTRWAHRLKPLSTRGGGAAEATFDKAMCGGGAAETTCDKAMCAGATPGAAPARARGAQWRARLLRTERQTAPC